MRAGLSHKEHALRSDKVASGRLLTLHRLPCPEGEPLRFSCIVSKKIARKAVDRNKMRRRMRAAFRAAAHGGLYVLHMKKSALTAPHAELVEEATRLFVKLAQ